MAPTLYRFLHRISIRLREVCIILNLANANLAVWKPVIVALLEGNFGLKEVSRYWD